MPHLCITMPNPPMTFFAPEKWRPESEWWWGPPNLWGSFLCRCSGGVRRPLAGAGWLFGLPGDLEAGAGVGQNSTSSANPHLWTCEASKCLNQRSKCCRPMPRKYPGLISGGCWGWSTQDGERIDCDDAFFTRLRITWSLPHRSPGRVGGGDYPPPSPLGGEHLESELEWGDQWAAPPELNINWTRRIQNTKYKE